MVISAIPDGPLGDAEFPQFSPGSLSEILEAIRAERPAFVCAPHVETSTGIILPDDYIKKVSEAVHSVGGLFVLDCIASGTVWADMGALGVDALITAPQKGWSGPACCALVMLSEKGTAVTRETKSSSFVVDLRKWLELMDSYEAGGFMYHATMPTDAMVTVRDMLNATKDYGFKKVADQAWQLGGQVRELFAERGLVSVAAPGYQAPGVVVVHHDDAAVAGKFGAAGTQIAAGVPFMIGEAEGTTTFRIGLFGIDKLVDPTVTTQKLKVALDVAVPQKESMAN